MNKILIVDDSELIRNQLATLLAQNAYEVIEAVDGVDGYNAAREHNPDLVITDLNMPNANGLELIGHLRENERFKDIDIVMLTTETGASLRKQGVALKIRGWINKPIKDDLILKLLEKLLKKRAQAA